MVNRPEWIHAALAVMRIGAVLVPVPLHPEKERKRTYNQSRLLAECAVQALDGQARVEELILG